MEATLKVARDGVRGWVRPVPHLEGLEVARTAMVKPLEFKGLVVQVSGAGLWLDQTPIPGPDRASQLRELSARLAKIWSNYRMLYPNGPPPIRRMYVLFDKWVVVKDAVEAIATIGRDDVLIPLAAPENWIPVVPAGPALDARLRSFNEHFDAVSAATKWVNPDSLLQHAMGTCKGSLRIPGTGPGDKRSEDEIRAAQHSHVLSLLSACECRGANVDAVENVLLEAAGGLTRPLQRLSLQLKAAGGKAVLADPDAPIMSVLVAAAAQHGAGTRPVTIRSHRDSAKKH
jgi:hypothetical protein